MHDSSPALTAAQIHDFIHAGFVRLDDAFSLQLAAECRAILWRETGCDPDDPATWTRPVVRLGFHAEPPFRAAANTPRLHAAYDQLVGPGRWAPPGGLGTFPVRFPSRVDPGDTGWHIDPSFGWEDAPDDFLAWRANIAAKGRALLMLFLLSDVGDDDAPTRLRVGSHLDIARRLAPAGPPGLSLRELAADDFAGAAARPEATATGPAGAVYLCHPFLVHAGTPHRGARPRFLAQPPLLPTAEFMRDRDSDDTPVAAAIRLALA